MRAIEFLAWIPSCIFCMVNVYLTGQPVYRLAYGYLLERGAENPVSRSLKGVLLHEPSGWRNRSETGSFGMD